MNKDRYAAIRERARRNIAERDTQPVQPQPVTESVDEFVFFETSEALLEALQETE